MVNSLLFFMNNRQKSTVLDSTFQMMLNYYNEETIIEAKALLHSKIAPEKRFIKRKGVGKARETLKDIHEMIVELDADQSRIKGYGGPGQFSLEGCYDVFHDVIVCKICFR